MNISGINTSITKLIYGIIYAAALCINYCNSKWLTIISLKIGKL